MLNVRGLFPPHSRFMAKVHSESPEDPMTASPFSSRHAGGGMALTFGIALLQWIHFMWIQVILTAVTTPAAAVRKA